MVGLLFNVAFFGFLQLLLLGVSIGIGYLLKWVVPGMDLGSAVLAGLISTIATVYVVFKAHDVAAAMRSASANEDSDEDDDEDDVWDDLRKDISRASRFVAPPSPRQRQFGRKR